MTELLRRWWPAFAALAFVAACGDVVLGVWWVTRPVEIEEYTLPDPPPPPPPPPAEPPPPPAEAPPPPTEAPPAAPAEATPPTDPVFDVEELRKLGIPEDQLEQLLEAIAIQEGLTNPTADPAPPLPDP